MPPSNHAEEQQSYGGQSFQPFEFDETVEPDLYDGSYELEISDVKFRMSNPDASTGVAYPQLVIEWVARETSEESEECRRSVGNTISEFLTFRPKGDRKGNMSKQRLTLLRNKFGIGTDVMPTQITSPSDFDDLRGALKGQRMTATAVNKTDKTGALRTNLVIEASGGGATEEDETPAKPAATKAAPKAATKSKASPSKRR
jgi:hypothetical protein